jgi:hypothetical protein
MREKLIELPIADAILILKEELKQRSDGYTTYLANGGKGDPAEEVNLDALAMAISALDNQVSSNKWIPVSERLPEYGQEVIVYTGNILKPIVMTYTFWNPEYDTWAHVTHWMPLPEPPKGE